MQINEEMRQLWYLDYDVSEDNKLYFSSGWFNGLVEADLNTGEGKIIKRFPDEENVVGDLHADVINLNDKLYFCPRNAKYFCVYDINTKELKCIELPDNSEYWKKRECKFCRIVHRGDFLYLIPINYNQILKFDLNTEKFDVIDKWFSRFEKITNYCEQEILFKAMFHMHMVCEEVVIWKIIGEPYLCVFKIETGDFSFIKFDDEIVSVEKGENANLFITQSGECCRYNANRNKIELVDRWDLNFEEIYLNFIRTDDICFFPSKLRCEMIVYDIKTKEKTYIDISTDKKIYENSIGRKWRLPLSSMKTKGSYIYMLNWHNEFIEFDTKTNTSCVRRLELCSEEKIEFNYKQNIDEKSSRYSFFPYKSNNPEMLVHYLSKQNDIGYIENVRTKGNLIYDYIINI